MEKVWLKNYSEGVPAEINPDAYASLVDVFEDSCKKYKSLPALKNRKTTLSYKQLNQHVKAVAAYLQQNLGIKKGDRLAIMMPNVLQYPVVMFAALSIGAIVVNVNPLYTVRELKEQLIDSGAETVVVLANFAHVLQEAMPESAVKNVIVTEVGDLLSGLEGFLINPIVKHIKKMVDAWDIPGALKFKQVLEDGMELVFEHVDVTGEDVAFLQYTGGTTGVAKGAVLTHRNMVANLEQAFAFMKPFLTEGKEVIITALPLYHIFSLTANCLVFLKIGATNVLITNPRDIPGFVKEMSAVKFTAITGVNTLFNALLSHKPFANLDFSHLSLTLGGGMAVQPTVAARWQKTTGKPLLEAYGLTETSPAVAINPLHLPAYNGSIGLPVPSTEVTIRDDDGRVLPIGEEGELYVRGPQVMREYWDKPKETQHVFLHDGWLCTGDVAKMNEEGFLYLLERKKDMILVSGFNVYPNEVEAVIAEMPEVAEVAVVGYPHSISGELVKAVIVKRDPELTIERVKSHCRNELTAYKVPKRVQFRDELPKTNVGKILRRELKEGA